VTAPDALADPPAGWLRMLLRAAIAPLACAVVLTGLLSAWVASGGAGTLTRVRIQVTLAAIPMRGFTSQSVSAPGRAASYLTIRNLTDIPDALVSARCPAARRVVLTGRAGTAQPLPGGLRVPAGGTLTLSPFGHDLVLVDPVALTDGQTVPLTLNFRRAGQVRVTATVTAPGSP